VSIVVNNVGIANWEENKVMPQSYQEIIDQVVVNCCSQVGMFKTVWPMFKERSNRLSCQKKCAFVDISSITSILPSTMIAIYAATKAFNRVFTLGLSSYLSNPLPSGPKDLATPIDFLSV
jgi:short-subunit dehydrogenase